MSLEGCIKKAGKALRIEDADAIRKIRDDIFAGGKVTQDVANQNAIDEYLSVLDGERNEILQQAEERGGVLADRSLSPSEFAKQATQRGKDRSALVSKRDALKTKEGELKAKQTPDLRFKIEDIDPFQRQLVDTYPKTPMSVTTKWGAVMGAIDDSAKIPPKGLRGLLERLTGGKISAVSKEGILNLLPQNKLPDVVPAMQSVTNYVDHMEEMNAYMERNMEDHADIGKTWLDFNKNNKKQQARELLDELITASTLTGVDLNNFQMPDAAATKKMSKKKRAMWKERQEHYEKLKPFWDKLGKIGKNIDYEEVVYTQGKKDKVSGLYPEGKMKVVRTVSMPEGQAIYNQVFNNYKNMRTRAIESVENRISAAEKDAQIRRSKIMAMRQIFESGKIPQYAPLMRFGDYAVVAKDPETGEVLAFYKRETAAERNRLLEELRAKNFQAYPINETSDDAALVKQIDPQFVTKVIDIIGKKAEGDVVAIQDEIWQMYLTALPEMSVRKNFIHRTGRLGFAQDQLRAFGHHTFHGTHQLAKIKYGYQLQNDLDEAKADADTILEQASIIIDLRKGINPKGHEGETPHQTMMLRVSNYEEMYKADVAKNPDTADSDDAMNARMDKLIKESEHEGPWATPVVNSLAKRHAFNMNPKSSSIATDLTAFGFLWFLSSSPAAGVLNLTQTAILGYPILRAAFNGQGAGMELLRASTQYATSGEMGSGDFGNQLRNDKDSPKGDDATGELAAFRYFEEIQMYAKTRTRDLMGLSERGTHRNDKVVRAAEIAGWIFHKTEEANRIVTSMAAYRLARKKFAGQGTVLEQHNNALILAKKLTMDAHFDYTNTNRPPIMQGDMGRVVFLFRNYSVNMQYRLIRDFKDGYMQNENLTIEVRKEARMRFNGMILMTSMFAGMSGWPLMAATHGLLDMFLGDDDDPFDSRTEFRVYLAEAFGEKLGEAIYKGPWDAFTGLSLANRASLNNLWIREVPEALRGKDLLLHLAGEGLGPLFGIGTNYFQGFQDVQDDHGWRGMEKFVPKAVADAMKSLRYFTQGAQNRQGDLILPPESFGLPILLGQAMGFTPSELVKQYEQNRAVKDMETRLRRRHDQLINRIFMGYRLQDRKVVRQTLRDIGQWNKSNPTYAITPATLQRSAKARSAYDMRTVGGIALDKRLQYLHNTLRFTERK